MFIRALPIACSLQHIFLPSNIHTTSEIAAYRMISSKRQIGSDLLPISLRIYNLGLSFCFGGGTTLGYIIGLKSAERHKQTSFLKRSCKVLAGTALGAVSGTAAGFIWPAILVTLSSKKLFEAKKE